MYAQVSTRDEPSRPVPRPLRSQPTRDRILLEARRLFSEHGFERTTVRAIATAAAINPAMVIRYYGSKEELFVLAAQINLKVPDLTAVPFSKRGETLISHFLNRWEGPDAGDELPALLRAAATHDVAREQFIALTIRQATPMIGAALANQGREDRIALVVIQMAGLAMSRYVLRHPLVVALSRETIVREVGQILQRIIAGE